MTQHGTRRLAALVVAASLVTIFPAVVVGHAELVTPTPAADSTVAGPVTEVSGTFSQAMTAQGSGLEVLDAQGGIVAKGGLDPADDTRLVVAIDPALAPGTYTVRWTSASTDGDIERGEWTFRVAAAASPSATPTAPATAPPGPTATSSVVASAVTSPIASPAAASPAPSATGGATGSGSDVILPIIVVLVVLGAGAAYLLSQRKRPTGRP